VVTRLAVGERVRAFKAISPGTAIQNALDARRQRIVLSGSSVNAVKWGALLVQAALILVTIAMVHCDNPAANRIILAVFATGAAATMLLIAAYSRPFSGALAVRPTLLLQVMPETPKLQE
jgi:hypothetical protein